MKRGIAGGALGWVAYFFIIANNIMALIEIPEEYDWAKQAIATIPLIIGHTYLGHRISKKWL